jgi:chromate transporter
MNTPSIRQLAWAVARDVNRTVGGGYAAMELMRRTFTSHGWLDVAGNALIVAVSRFTPGTNALAYCVALGWRLRGTRGALAALAAGSVPASVVIAVLTATVAQIDRYRIVQIVLALGSAVAVFLIFSAAWHLLRPYAVRSARSRSAVIMGVTAVLLLLDVTPVRTLLVSAAVGLLLPPGLSERRNDAP